MNNELPNHDAIPMVPDHDMIRPIGQGSYGEVWLARNVVGTYRAVKVVHRDQFDSDRPYEREFNGIQRFEPVSRTHPGLVSILHIGRNQAEGFFYYVMELADDVTRGETFDPAEYRPLTLAARLKGGRLPLLECVDIAQQLVAALARLHERGLIHRDIKPSNIIFVGGAPKIADIGLVTGVGEKATFVGTEAYLPPERPGTASADLYSFGKVLYEMSMGKRADEFPELPTRLLELEDAAGLVKLNEIVLRSCDPDPRKRFPSANDLYAALSRLAAETAKPAATVRPSYTGGGAPPVRRLSVVVLRGRGNEAESAVVQLVRAELESLGHVVFVDPHPEPDVRWGRDLESRIRNSEVVIPVISKESAHDEMLAYGVELAAQTRRLSMPSLQVLVVRAGYTEPMPTILALNLGSAREWLWEDAADDEQVRSGLRAALAQSAA